VEYRLRATLPPTLEAMEKFFAELRWRVEGAAGHADRFMAELLMREALTNAVIHGCHGDAGKRVHCVLRLRGRRLTIAVRDEGEGFDWRAARGCRAGARATSGRGVEILRQYATRIRFNDKGNSVTVMKRFS
jgi:anti-sigma regulatory factor (Ser/Thr protein kinase)